MGLLPSVVSGKALLCGVVGKPEDILTTSLSETAFLVQGDCQLAVELLKKGTLTACLPASVKL